MDYTPEQIADIQEREAKALEMLKELQLTPAAQISKSNLGNDVFGDKIQPYLRDLKFTPTESTIDPNESAEKIA